MPINRGCYNKGRHITEEDLLREQDIKKELNCQFLRIDISNIKRVGD